MDNERIGKALNDASGLLVRFEREDNDINILTSAIDQTKAALEEAIPGDQLHTIGLTNISAMYLRRYERNMNVDDLNSAETMASVAVALTPDSDDDGLCIRANTLASVFKRKHDLSNELNDISSGITLLKDVIQKIPDKHPDKAMTLNNYGCLLLSRYQRLCDIEDLDDAINIIRSAIRVTSSDWIVYLGERKANLAHMLQLRSLHTGHLNDLHEALGLSQDALRSSGQSPWRVLALSNYGNQYESLYRRTNERKDLDRAIAYTKEAYKLIPDDDSRQLGILDNLACKYQLLGSLDDIRHAVELGREAVARTAAHDSGLAARLHNLSNHLASLHEVSQESENIIEAIQMAEQALDLTPQDHPVRTRRLYDLAREQLLYYESTGKVSARTDAWRNLLEAWNLCSAVPFERVSAGAFLLKLFCRSTEYKSEEATAIAEGLINLLPVVNTRSLPQKDRQDAMLTFSGVAANACAVFLNQNDTEKALNCLEKGRAVIIGDLIDGLSDIGRLKHDHEELANRFICLRGILNASGQDQDGGQLRNDVEKRQKAAGDFMACIEEIQSKAGYERFMTGQTIPEMQAFAEEGYIIVVNLTELRSDAIVVCSEGIRAFNLPDLSAFDAQNWLKTDWMGDEKRFGPMNILYCQYLEWLWKKCVKKIFEELQFDPVKGGELPPRVWWIGSGLASSMPFHAAGFYGKKGERISAMDWATSSYTPSIKALGYAQTRARGAASASLDLLVVAMRKTPGCFDLNVLPEEFLDSIRDDFNPVILDGPENCCVQNVMDQLNTRSMVHFACHGETDHAYPSSSRLLLQVKDSSGWIVQDWLTVEDIVGINLTQARLAYLSACSTAQNRVTMLADEVIHLASGFQVAGFAHVIGCLWPTRTDASAKAAARFYRSLARSENSLSGRGVADALRTSVMALREEYRRIPLLWVQFVHYGA